MLPKKKNLFRLYNVVSEAILDYCKQVCEYITMVIHAYAMLRWPTGSLRKD